MFVYINNKQLLFIAENKEANYCETHMYIIWNGYQNNETNKLILYLFSGLTEVNF